MKTRMFINILLKRLEEKNTGIIYFYFKNFRDKSDSRFIAMLNYA